MKRSRGFLFGVLSIFLLLSVSYGYVVVEMNLKQIVSKSKYIFRGVCEKRESAFVYPQSSKSAIPATEYTFVVKEMLKGEFQERVIFKQYGVSRAEAQKSSRPMAVGFTTFVPGKEYVVALSPPSSSGFSDVVGFAGGVFDVLSAADGKIKIVNKFSNSNLFKGFSVESSVSKSLKSQGVDVASPPKGPMDYDAFKKAVDILK